MKSGSLFWAVVLILVGVVLLLGNLGVVAVTWGLIWPLVLIAFGIWILWGGLFAPSSVEVVEDSIPLQGATSARVRINHGAGRLRIGAGALTGDLVSGAFGGGLDKRILHDGDRLDVRMRVPDHGFPFAPWHWARGAFDWTVSFNREVALELRLETGASANHLDLRELRVTDLRLQTGASATVLRLPATAGQTRARIEAGAASVEIHVPDGVAARIRTQAGLAAIKVDTSRFPRTGGEYRSPDYGTAANCVDLEIEAGVGSVEVK
ncbi:MAG: hypothetical protein FJ011_17355 [Chloroflexi bacterium]|nr:hypothetical protein [Chloroflexota bacterium]